MWTRHDMIGIMGIQVESNVNYSNTCKYVSTNYGIVIDMKTDNFSNLLYYFYIDLKFCLFVRLYKF